MEDFSPVTSPVNFNVPVSDKPVTSPVNANAKTLTSSTFEAPDTLSQPHVPTLVHGQPLDPQPPRQNTIDWLLELGRPPLPVAPAQDPHLYPLLNKKGEVVFETDGVTPKPKFTGKNPSYLDENDIPHTVSHGKYQKRQPNAQELDTWFANPRNGVGSLGSDKWAFVDLDRHKFNAPELTPEQAQQLCDAAGERIIQAAKAETSKLPPYEKTQSGGWRVVVGLSKPPTFTNFCLTPGGDHVGEVLGKGRFAVLAPTVGPTGQSYEAYHRCAPDEIPVIDELEKLTLHPVKASRRRPRNATTPNDSQPALTPVSDSSTPNVDGSTPNVDGSTPNVDGSTPNVDGATSNVDASSSNSTSHATQIFKKYPQLRDKVFELRDLGTDTTRDVLAGVDEKGDRSGSLTTAIRDWYGWENWCRVNGITYRGDTRSLAVEAADKLKIEDYEDRVDRILNGIDASSCTTSCEYKGNGDDEGCWKRVVKLAGVKGSKRFFTSVFPDKPLPSPLNAKVIPLPTAMPLPKAVGDIESGSGGSGGNGNNRNGTGGNGGDGGDGSDGGNGDDNGKVVRFPNSDSETQEWIFSEIDSFIAQGVSGSALTGKLNQLADASHIYVGELRKLYYERLSESDLEVERGTHQGEIEKLLTLTEASLDLNDYLPPDLAEPITLFCKWLAIRPAVALTALLAAASTLHCVGTELILHKNQNFRVPPNIYSALISSTGQRKSPITKNIITLPLRKLRREKQAAYRKAMKAYKAELKVWEENGCEGEEPEKPKDPPLYYFTKTTGEAISIQAEKAPNKPLFGLIDELAGLFKSANSYRGGRGSDVEDLLSYFDGSGETVLRATGISAEVDTIYLSIFGTIQPEILKREMGDCSDPAGKWARFIFVHQPLEAATLSEDDGEAIQIHEIATDYYRRIEQIPEMEYRLSRQAFKRYIPIYNELERLRVTHPKPGMQAVFGKMQGYIGRLALNLHVLWELAAGKECPDAEIPLSIMEMAIALAKFYFGQVKLLHAGSDEESVPTQILKLVELSKRLDLNGKDGWIKAQTYREQFASKKRPSAQKARDWMLEATTLGFGRTRGSGNRLEYHWMKGGNDEDNGKNPPPTPNLGKLREDLGNTLPYVETLENKGVEANLGNLGNLGKNFEKTSPAPTCGDNSLPLKPTCGDKPLPEKELEESFLPNSSLSSLSSLKGTSNVDAERDTHLGNSFPNSSLSFPNSSLTEEKPDLGNHSLNPSLTEENSNLGNSGNPTPNSSLTEENSNLGNLGNHSSKPSLTEEAPNLGNLFPNPSLNFPNPPDAEEAITTPCASDSPAVAEVAQPKTPNLVGRRIRAINSRYTNFGQTFTICRQDGDILYYIKGPGLGCLQVSEIGTAWELLE